MGRERFEAEFGVYAAWIAERAQTLPPPERPAGVCRGTGDPTLLELVADAGRLSPGMTVLDAGCGLGGPAAWFASARGCWVAGVDVMHSSAAGAGVLFPNLSFVTSSLRHLPFGSDAFDGATCLGVVELIDDKDRAFTELSRVLVPNGRLVLYDYVAAEERILTEAPVADRFVSLDDLIAAATRGGLSPLHTAKVNDVVPASSSWGQISRRIHNDVASAHRHDPLLATIESEQSLFNALRRRGSIEPWLLVMENVKA